MLARTFIRSLRTSAPARPSTSFLKPSSRPSHQLPTLPTSAPFRRHASQRSLPGGRPQKRITYAQALLFYWRTSGAFRTTAYAGGGGLVVFVAANIESVPVSGRKRFNWVSPAYEEQMGEQQYREVLQQYKGKIMSAQAPEAQAVHRVLNRLIPQSGIDQHREWVVHVIDEAVANAFVLPGGRVFVFRGILPICVDDDGLAAVLGHEIAHNVAHHSAENLSRISFVLPLAWAASFLFDISGQLTYLLLDLAYSRPGSRRQETEADFIGLMMMAQSCYDPEKAIGLWQRMEKQGGAKPPQFLSTHPSDHNRVRKIQEWLPQAQEKRAEASCGQTLQYADDFKRAVGSAGGDLWDWN